MFLGLQFEAMAQFCRRLIVSEFKTQDPTSAHQLLWQFLAETREESRGKKICRLKLYLTCTWLVHGCLQQSGHGDSQGKHTSMHASMVIYQSGPTQWVDTEAWMQAFGVRFLLLSRRGP